MWIFILTSCGKAELAQETVVPDTTEVVTTETPEVVEEVVEEIIPPSSPSFTKTSIDFEHSFDSSMFSFLGWTFIDTDNDGNNEFLITGWKGQSDGLFRYKNGAVENIIANSGITNSSAGYGSYAIDFDTDGDEDLFVTRHDGVYYYDNTNGTFTEKKLDIVFPDRAAPLDVELWDIDNDGDLDMFVSTFVDPAFFKAATFNNPSIVQKSLLLRNDGDLTFTDITDESGLVVVQNIFAGNFVDLDNDGDQDIVISPNTDSVKIFENNGWQFTLAFESDIYSFWMGLAMNDVDNDGDVDLFFSSIGTSIPASAVQWDSTADQDVVTQYLFLENTGAMTFAEKKDPAFGKLGFGWGIIPVDFDLNSRDDYLVMQNYIKWSPHKLSKLPGELLTQAADGTFSPSINDVNLSNKAYGISALVWDINGDDLDDVIYLNLNGKQRVHLRDADENNLFLKVQLPNTPKYLHANVEMTLSDGSTMKKAFLPKQGLLTKQDSSVIFGLNGKAATASSVTVSMRDGNTQNFEIERGQKVLEVK